MKVVGRIVNLKPDRAFLHVSTADNNKVNCAFQLKLGEGLHSKLLKNVKNWVLLDISDGYITKFEKVVDMDKLGYVFCKKFDVMGRVLGANSMKKADFYLEYSKFTGCSHRTAQRHLSDAIEQGYVEQDDKSNVALVTSVGSESTE